MKIRDILRDMQKFEEAAVWLYEVQGKYGAANGYATSAENTLASDMYVMRDLFAMELGLEMIRNHRKDLDRIARKES